MFSLAAIDLLGPLEQGHLCFRSLSVFFPRCRSVSRARGTGGLWQKSRISSPEREAFWLKKSRLWSLGSEQSDAFPLGGEQQKQSASLHTVCCIPTMQQRTRSPEYASVCLVRTGMIWTTFFLFLSHTHTHTTLGILHALTCFECACAFKPQTSTVQCFTVQRGG